LISVEHVLPQNPAEESQWLKEFSEDDRERWTHRLGNLLLLNKRKNSEAGRRDFADKKATYFLSPNGTVTFALTSQVLSEPVWTVEVVLRRHKVLMKRLTDEWQLG
jgi:hypothetical protein